MNHQRFKDIHRLGQIIGFKIPMDGLLMLALRKPVIDIIALDERLMRNYKYDGSMSDFIISKFGTEAWEIINRNI